MYCLDNDLCKQLTKKEQIELIVKYKENNDLEAREKLLFSNLKLIYKFVDDFKYDKLESHNMDDLIQQAMLITLECIDMFDYNSDVKFSTYLYKSLYGQLVRYISNTDRLVRIPVESLRQFNKINKTIIELEYETNKKVTFEDLQKKMNITKQKYNHYKRYYANFYSLNEPLLQNENGSKEPLDLLVEPDNPYATVINEPVRKAIKKAYYSLNKDQQRLIGSIYVKDDKINEYASKTNVCKSAIYEMKKRALKNFKNYYLNYI